MYAIVVDQHGHLYTVSMPSSFIDWTFLAWLGQGVAWGWMKWILPSSKISKNNFLNILNVISDDRYGHLMRLELGKKVIVKIIFLHELSVLESHGTESS